MADFCKQCSFHIFGEDHEDLANLTTPEQTVNGVYARALCEGCGFIQVDHTGLCMSNCLEQHNKIKEQQEGI